MKEEPLVSIIVPILNEETHIKNCLEDIKIQDYPRNKFEIYVVDGGSKDKSVEIVRRFKEDNPDIGLGISDELGKSISAAMNIGLRSAKGDFILKVDAHTKYEKDYISKCVEFLLKMNSDCVGGAFLPTGTDYKTKAISLALKNTFGSGGGRFHEGDYEGLSDAVYLGAYTKTILDKIKGWDENILDEDEDLFYRIKKEGGKIFLTPKIKSYYHVYPSIKKLGKVYFEYGYSKVFFARKHNVFCGWINIFPPLFVVFLLTNAIVGFLFPDFWILSSLALMLYGLAVIVISTCVAFKNNLKYFPALLIVFPTIHFGYSFGFLAGIFNVAFLYKKQ